MITAEAFGDWLRLYGAAWIGRDPQAAVEAPMVGLDAIRRYWAEGAQAGQRDVTFAATVCGLEGDTGCAHWRATFFRVPGGSFVELDGVLAACFAADGRCCEFREWWHRRETPAAP
jgi:SnoaL-like domain